MVTVIKQGASKKTIAQKLSKLKVKKGIDAKKYSGVLKLKESPLSIQKKLRDEWS